MGKLLVNGAIEVTSHITIKNGADLYLSAPSSTPDDSGDLVFTKYDGTEQGRIWISGGVGSIRFSGSDTSKTLIHSGNIGSQSVNYANSAGSVPWGNVTGKPSSFTPSSHNHTSLTGITSLDFSAHSDDGATIKTTIDNTSTYLDFNLVDDGESDFFRWNFGRWDNATSSQQNVTLMTLTCAQSTNSAKLIVNGAIQGSLDWNYITNKPSTFTPSSHGHSSLSALVIDDNLAYNMIGTDSSGGGPTYNKALLSTLCSRYPNYGGNFAGRYWPNAYGFLLGNIYNTSITSSGLPQYSTFIGCNLSEAPRIFGTYNYNHYEHLLLTSNNYYSYALPLSGGTMTDTTYYNTDTPFYFYGAGTGTYTCGCMYVNASGGMIFETPRSGDDISYAPLPFRVVSRGGWASGYYAPLYCQKVIVQNYGSSLPSSGVTGEVFYKT